MNKIKKIIFAAIIFILLKISGYAQGGANYTIFGIGELNTVGNAAFEGLAGTSIAFPDENAINFRNPAMWSTITSTRINVGYRFNQSLAFSDLASSFQNHGALTGMSTLFMIDTSLGLAASLGIMPYSNVNYLIATPIEETINDIYLKGRTIYQGKGGISMIYFGGASNITKYASVGVSIFSTFGKVASLRKTEYFGDPYAFAYTSARNDFFSGFGYKLGLSVKPTDGLILGMFFENYPTMDVETDIVYTSTLLPDTSVRRNNSHTVPNNIGFGASYRMGKFTFGVDYSMQDFSDFDYNVLSNSKYKTGSIISIGINRLGNKSINAPLSDKTSYKFGAYYKQHYFSVNENDISEVGFALGFQIPWSGTFISDIAILGGYRGTQNDGLIREYFGRLSVDISIGETWFKPFRRDY